MLKDIVSFYQSILEFLGIGCVSESSMGLFKKLQLCWPSCRCPFPINQTAIQDFSMILLQQYYKFTSETFIGMCIVKR